MIQAPKVYIVILNWNGWKDTVECLESVFRLDYPNYRVVVCDNDSSDQSLNHIERWAQGLDPVEVDDSNPLKRLSSPNVPKPIAYSTYTAGGNGSAPTDGGNEPLILLPTGGNLGFAGGNNAGLRYVLEQGDADYVWLLNNDTVVEPAALSEMVLHSKALSGKGSPNTCGSLVCFYSDPEVVQAYGGATFNRWSGIASQTLGRFEKRDRMVNHEEVANSLNYITGCSWLLPIDFIASVGLMEERYFLYYEEIDWVTRSNGQFKITYAPKSIIYHKEGSSIGSKTIRRAPSLLSEYYMTRSKVLFTLRFNPVAIPFVYLLSTLQAVNRVRQGYPKNALAILKAILGMNR